MKHAPHTDKEAIDKLNAFYIYKTAGFDRVREILPQQTNFCQANSGKSYDELRNELLKSTNQNHGR